MHLKCRLTPFETPYNLHTLRYLFVFRFLPWSLSGRRPGRLKFSHEDLPRRHGPGLPHFLGRYVCRHPLRNEGPSSLAPHVDMDQLSLLGFPRFLAGRPPPRSQTPVFLVSSVTTSPRRVFGPEIRLTSPLGTSQDFCLLVALTCTSKGPECTDGTTFVRHPCSCPRPSSPPPVLVSGFLLPPSLLPP